MRDRWPTKVDEAFVDGRDDGLQLGVNLQLLDHMPHVPLDCMVSNIKPLGHRSRVEPGGEQI